MNCEKCQDQGQYPLDRGGITSQFCDCEAGEKFRTKTLAEMGIEEPAQDSVQLEDLEAVYIGIAFYLLGLRTDEHSDEELWEMVKQTAIEKMEFPGVMSMPCGNDVRFDDPSEVLALPIEDILCSCGNPNHYAIRFLDNRKELPKKRKAANLKKKKRANSNSEGT